MARSGALQQGCRRMRKGCCGARIATGSGQRGSPRHGELNWVHRVGDLGLCSGPPRRGAARATASAVPASERAYGPLQLAHNDKEGPGVLTEAWTRANRQRRVVSIDGRRWRMTKLGGEVDAGVLRASGTHDPVHAGSVEVQWGSDRTTVHRRRGIAVADKRTCGGAPEKFRRRRGPRSGQQARGWSWSHGEAAARLCLG